MMAKKTKQENKDQAGMTSYFLHDLIFNSFKPPQTDHNLTNMSPQSLMRRRSPRRARKRTRMKRKRMTVRTMLRSPALSWARGDSWRSFSGKHHGPESQKRKLQTPQNTQTFLDNLLHSVLFRCMSRRFFLTVHTIFFNKHHKNYSSSYSLFLCAWFVFFPRENWLKIQFSALQWDFFPRATLATCAIVTKNKNISFLKFFRSRAKPLVHIL